MFSKVNWMLLLDVFITSLYFYEIAALHVLQNAKNRAFVERILQVRFHDSCSDASF